MLIIFKKTFGKKYTKLPVRIKRKFCNVLKLFKEDPFHPLLKNHRLQGKWRDYRSVNITADVRAVYLENENVAIFVTIGVHTELYE